MRILPDFSTFCRSNPLILLNRLALRQTLDLRIGVRIPASQPITQGFRNPLRPDYDHDAPANISKSLPY